MSEPELKWLMMMAAEMDSVVEVGSLHGRSAFALCTACEGNVYCVDTWSDEHDKSFPSFMGHVGHFPNLHACRGWSTEMAATFPDLSVDMTFLDGSHAYESVLADLSAWLPKTKRLICGHDYFDGPKAGFPGVAQAVKEVFGGDRVMVGYETAIWFVDLEEDRSTAKISRVIDYTDEYGRAMTAVVEL